MAHAPLYSGSNRKQFLGCVAWLSTLSALIIMLLQLNQGHFRLIDLY